MTRPVCECHGEPMLKNGSGTGRQAWTCAVRNRERCAADHARNGETRRERRRQRYFETGWRAKRLRDLAHARADVINRLRET